VRPASDEIAPGTLAIAQLIYSAIASLDGYVPDRQVGTYLLGRGMYEVLVDE
jgi:hypothetical protein